MGVPDIRAERHRANSLNLIRVVPAEGFGMTGQTYSAAPSMRCQMNSSTLLQFFAEHPLAFHLFGEAA